MNQSKKSKSANPLFSPEDQKQLQERIDNTKIEQIDPKLINLNPRNAKKHSDKQIALLTENFFKFGMLQPIVVDETNTALIGNARLMASLRSGVASIPVIRLMGLTAGQKRALALADNKLSELGEWDMDVLAEELKALSEMSAELNFELDITGFATVEVDRLISGSKPKKKDDPADKVPSLGNGLAAVSKTGDLWKCGSHLVLCGNALQAASYRRLLGDDQADIVFTDHPYNVSIRGHVSTRPAAREFLMGSGEMSSDEFVAFLRNSTALIADNMRPGGVAYLCMDWAHLYELFQATHRVLGEPKNLIVWVKSNAGMGSFYRSQHEHIAVFVTGGASPTNNFGLGARGRYRTNVWNYPGVNSLGSERDATLAMHPTVKPVALVEDALRDCSHRNEIVLDPFAGSGTTMIAAQKSGRHARLIEIDPFYCDVIVRRFQEFTGESAVLTDTGETFVQREAAKAPDAIELVRE
jgi:DNA modification methylase